MIQEIVEEENRLFKVVKRHGRNYLLNESGNVIAECINGDFRKRYGGLEGWLAHIENRSVNRMNNISEQIDALLDEESLLMDRIATIQLVLRETK